MMCVASGLWEKVALDTPSAAARDPKAITTFAEPVLSPAVPMSTTSEYDAPVESDATAATPGSTDATTATPGSTDSTAAILAAVVDDLVSDIAANFTN
jgi:hypothetical protein